MRSVRRIVDRPEHHEAPGAWEWDEAARRHRDSDADRAARRFLRLDSSGTDCWRCEAAPGPGALGLCPACLNELRKL